MRGTCRNGYLLAVFLVASLLAACSSIPIGEYSLEAYKNATTLKAETLALVAKSGQPYSRLADDVDVVSVRIDAAYEFAAGLPDNQLSAEQWRLMRDPEGHLYGGFVVLWRNRGTLSPAFRDELRAVIGDAFDEIICLEANKQSQTRC
jgi:hypothetical protein